VRGLVTVRSQKGSAFCGLLLAQPNSSIGCQRRRDGSDTSAALGFSHGGAFALANRCVVPFTSFCEYADTKPKKTPTWFAFDDSRPLAFFAGIWMPWKGTRGSKAKPVEGETQLFGFLTTDANAEVGAIHPKAMPVILTTPSEIEAWMSAPAGEALKLQRPLPDGAAGCGARGTERWRTERIVNRQRQEGSRHGGPER
jgi:putative SOS response-associated peptidase YedK